MANTKMNRKQKVYNPIYIRGSNGHKTPPEQEHVGVDVGTPLGSPFPKIGDATEYCINYNIWLSKCLEHALDSEMSRVLGKKPLAKGWKRRDPERVCMRFWNLVELYNKYGVLYLWDSGRYEITVDQPVSIKMCNFHTDVLASYILRSSKSGL